MFHYKQSSKKLPKGLKLKDAAWQPIHSRSEKKRTMYQLSVSCGRGPSAVISVTLTAAERSAILYFTPELDIVKVTHDPLIMDA